MMGNDYTAKILNNLALAEALAANNVKPQSHDLFIWPCGTCAYRAEIEAGDYDWMSDDYRLATPEESARFHQETWGEPAQHELDEMRSQDYELRN